MRAHLLATLVLCGCRFEPAAAPDDARRDGPGDGGADAIDGDIDAPPATCLERWLDGSVRLKPPSRLDLIASNADERDPFVTADEQQLLFASDRPGGGLTDIYAATRDGDQFGDAELVGELSSAAVDSRASLTANGLIAVVSSTRTPSEGQADLFIAIRGTPDVPFEPPENNLVQNVNNSDTQLDPEISANGLHLYLAAGAPQRIVVATRGNVTASFSSTKTIDELISAEGDADPALSPDERVIVFSSLRPGPPGGSNLWYATRASVPGVFAAPELVPDVNSDSLDGDPALSVDGCRLYFASNRGGGSGRFDLYVAELDTP